MSPERWKMTCAPGMARIEAVYWRGLGRATRTPLERMKSSVASSMRPLLGSARRSLSEVMMGGEILAVWAEYTRCRDAGHHPRRRPRRAAHATHGRPPQVPG